MTARVLLSELGSTKPDDFTRTVEQYARDLRDHRDHHERLAAQNGLSEEEQSCLPALERLAPYPAPPAHPLLLRCLRQPELTPDFELVRDEDLRTDRQKRDALLDAIAAEECRLIDEVLPPKGRRRAIAVRLTALAQPDATVSERDRAFVDDHSRREWRAQTMRHHATEQMALVEDLPAEQLDTWTWKPFPV